MTRPYTLPETYEDLGSVLVEIPLALVPFVAGALKPYERRYLWASNGDYERAYNAFAELQRDLMGKGLQDLLEANRQIYRLLDTALNGTVYSATPPTNPPPATLPDPTRPVISPAIPSAPPAPAAVRDPAALRAQLRRLHQLAENAATGAAYSAGEAGVDGGVGLDFDGSWVARIRAVQGIEGGFFGIGAQPVTLAKLLQAGRINTPADQGLINDAVEELLTATAQGANIAQVISGIIGDAANVATDGGAIAATLAATAASITSNALLSQQLQRIIDSLDGGGLVRPAGNVLASTKAIETMVS